MTKLYTANRIILSDILAAQLAENPGEYVQPLASSGVGDRNVSFIANRGLAAGDYAAVTGLRGVLAASGMQQVGISPTSTTVQRYTALEEAGGGGASALSDAVGFFSLLASHGGPGKLRVLGLGRITGGVAPEWAWATGGIDTSQAIVRAGAGDYTFARTAGWGGQGFVITKPSAAYTASGLSYTAANTPTGTAVQVTALQETGGGGASALTDMDVDVAILDIGRNTMRPQGQLHAWGSVSGSTLVSQSGGVASVNNTGTGLYTLTMAGGWGIAANECVMLMSPRGVMAASGLQGLGYTRPTPDTFAITAGQEAGGGNASVLADFDFDFAILRV